MKSAATLAIIAASLCLVGCAALPKSAGNTPSASSRGVGDKSNSVVTRDFGQPDVEVAQGSRKLSTMPVVSAAPQTVISPDPEPDAVIKLDPGNGEFSSEMESRLARIANEARQDERIILRLESHVPDRGSPALNIGIAEKALQKVKERLLAHGVLPRRILLASFGGEHEKERDPLRHWVEIYLLRPGY